MTDEVQTDPAAPSDTPAPARRSPRVSVALLTLAATGLLVVGLQAQRAPTADEEPQPLKMRGAKVSLSLLRGADAGAEPLVSFSQVHPGEVIRFEVSAKQEGFLLVYGVDGAGSRYAAYPRGEAPQAAKVGVGEHALDGAIQLDAVPGDETLSAVLCEQPFSLDTLDEDRCSVARVPLRNSGEAPGDTDP